MSSRIRDMINRKTFPYVTVGIIVLNVAYFVILVIGGSPANAGYMLSRGADFAPYVFEKFEVWRLLTSMFMHFSVTHLAANMIYLGILGFTYEKAIGHVKFLVIYMLSGIGAGLVSCAVYQISQDPVVSAGASGALYGLIGMVIYLMYTATKRTGSGRMFGRVGIMLIFMFYSSFRSGKGIDIAAHIGGLVFGILLSIMFLPVRRNKKK
ncbi:MAG: rhomboid family intramembrane serine protease [Parasporobacterium sp.]|nr:rhomboid family intramembrane serine protease [Parasporobacterium sp.]